jgi:hypothetical protein
MDQVSWLKPIDLFLRIQLFDSSKINPFHPDSLELVTSRVWREVFSPCLGTDEQTTSQKSVNKIDSASRDLSLLSIVSLFRQTCI